jgi:hypothetical protein
MAARGLTLLVGGVVVGAAIGIAVGAVRADEPGWPLGNTSTGVSLRLVEGSCTLTGKATEVVVRKNKKLTWEVKNFCEQAQTVSVGNFRRSALTGNKNCGVAIEGEGVPSPFQQDGPERRTAAVNAASGNNPGKVKIQLLLKSEDALPGDQEPYYFSLCLGAGESQKVVDPRLVIER